MKNETKAKRQWEAIEDGGATEIFDATDLAEAIVLAENWARKGDYDGESVTVNVYVRLCEGEPVYGDEATQDTISVHIEADEPECTETGHDWRHDWRIGCNESPGVTDTGGAICSHYVCANCGIECEIQVGYDNSKEKDYETYSEPDEALAEECRRFYEIDD